MRKCRRGSSTARRCPPASGTGAQSADECTKQVSGRLMLPRRHLCAHPRSRSQKAVQAAFTARRCLQLLAQVLGVQGSAQTCAGPSCKARLQTPAGQSGKPSVLGHSCVICRVSGLRLPVEVQGAWLCHMPQPQQQAPSGTLPIPRQLARTGARPGRGQRIVLCWHMPESRH